MLQNDFPDVTHESGAQYVRPDSVSAKYVMNYRMNLMKLRK